MFPFPTTRPSIAMLHSVGIKGDELLNNWSISKTKFTQFLDTVEQQGFCTTHFAEQVESQDKKKWDYSKQVIITFDDCAKHLFDFAIPELVKRKMKAVFYMPTANIGGYNSWDADKGSGRLELMNETDLRTLVSLGMEVGSHSHNHIELTKCSGERIEHEVRQSKTIIENITQKTVHSFAYPFGTVPENSKQILSEAGYKYGVCIYHPHETNFTLRRFGVYEKDDSKSLNRKLSKRYQLYRSMYDAVKKYD